MRLQPAIFLDRDGVINHDSDEYIKSWDEFEFYPGVLEALRQLHQAGCEVYVVTNQAGIGRGLFPRRHLLDILLRLRLEVRQAGGLIHGIAYCPHSPDCHCACRKPQPGMLLKLATKYGLDLSRSVLVGDSCTDMEAAQAAGCHTVFLHTRRGQRAEEHLQRCTRSPDFQAQSLLQAAPYLLRLNGAFTRSPTTPTPCPPPDTGWGTVPYPGCR